MRGGRIRALAIGACFTLGLAFAAPGVAQPRNLDAQASGKRSKSSKHAKRSKRRSRGGPTKLGGSTNAGSHRSQKSVVMYATKWCGACKKARQYMRKKGIRYTEVDIEKSRSGRRRMRQYNPNGTIPTIVVGNDVIIGFRPQAIQAAVRPSRSRTRDAGLQSFKKKRSRKKRRRRNAGPQQL